MKHLVVSALALAIAAPAFADTQKTVTPLSVASTQTVVSTQGSVLIGSLGTSSTASVGSVLTMGAAAAVQSTGHTK